MSGFIYIWFDKKHRRFYIGSHWGSEDDGYICSSTWMRNAYKRRPDDFKRRIVAVIESSRNDLLIEEHRWLQMIAKEELGKKFYNLTNHLNGHWFTSDEDRVLSLKEKISKKTKEAMARPEVRQKYEEAMENRAPTTNPEQAKKRVESFNRTIKERNKDKPVIIRRAFGSEEYRDNMAKSTAESWKKKDKKAIAAKVSASLIKSKETRSKTMSSLKWYNDGSISKRLSANPGAGWKPGRI